MEILLMPHYFISILDHGGLDGFHASLSKAVTGRQAIAIVTPTELLIEL